MALEMIVVESGEGKDASFVEFTKDHAAGSRRIARCTVMPAACRLVRLNRAALRPTDQSLRYGPWGGYMRFGVI